MWFLCSAPVRWFFRPVVATLLALAVTGCGGRGDVAGKVELAATAGVAELPAAVHELISHEA